MACTTSSKARASRCEKKYAYSFHQMIIIGEKSEKINSFKEENRK